ncbi:MAG: hypothetical protein AB7F23_02820 [Phycisphaerae bacterium]|jgi:hypothetical protein
MRRLLVCALLAPLAFAAELSIEAENFRATLTTSADETTYGSRIEAVAEYEAGEAVLSPKLTADSEDVVLIEKDSATGRLEYEIEPEKMGNIETLISLSYEGQAGEEVVYPFGKLKIRVVSALDEQDNAVIASAGAKALADSFTPAPEPLTPPLNWPLICGISVAALALAVGIIALFLRAKRRAAQAPRFEVLHKRAYRLLDDLRFAELPAKGEMKRYVYVLCGILRNYIELRFSLPATEQTSDEFLADVSSRNVFSAEQKRALEGFLTSTDMVKFAGFSPSLQQANELMEVAREFVRSTEDYNYMVLEQQGELFAEAVRELYV